jgi:hypothetical protein
MTLKEIIEKHGLPVKVQHGFWSKSRWFEIVAHNGDYAVGFFNNKQGNYRSIHDDNMWRLYTEPK